MSDIVDYAHPLIRIERLAKDIHDLCVDGKFGEAQEQSLRLGAEARLLHHTLELMKEKPRGYHQTSDPAATQEGAHRGQTVLSRDRREHAPQSANGASALRRQKN